MLSILLAITCGLTALQYHVQSGIHSPLLPLQMKILLWLILTVLATGPSTLLKTKILLACIISNSLNY